MNRRFRPPTMVQKAVVYITTRYDVVMCNLEHDLEWTTRDVHTPRL